MKYYFKIANTVVEISFDNDEVKDYLEKDFGLLVCQPCEPSIKLEVKNNTDMLPSDIKNDDKFEFRIKEGYLYQYFSAFQRHFWARYCFCENRTEVSLFIPYGNKGIGGQFLSPYFENPFQSCLIDYFHNTFLALLQSELMQREASLFHCSAFKLDSFNDAIVLGGGAQCGKSSLMTALSNFEPVEIYAEDFAVVTSEHVLYGYLHQTRVKFSDMNGAGLKFQPNKDGIISGVLNRCNKRVYSLLTNNKNGRHFSIKEYYHGRTINNRTPLKHRIFLLTRGDSDSSVFPVELKSFCRIQTEIMLSEFRNMRGAMGLFKNLLERKGIEWREEYLYNKICGIYEKTFKDLQCYNLEISYYPQVESAAKELKRIILNLDNK